ncbi:MAG: DUF192 domain-containing protein [Rhizobiaceae bacterium]
MLVHEARLTGSSMLKSHTIMRFALAAFMLAGSCAGTVTVHAQQAQSGQTQKLEVEKLAIVTGQGRFEFDAEIADEPREHATGLMFREKMAPNAGMLFDFGAVRSVTMWMRNTPLPLDMVFIRPDGTVAGISERTTPFSIDIIESPEPVSHVLELNAGIARMIGLKVGDQVEHRSLTKDQ